MKTRIFLTSLIFSAAFAFTAENRFRVFPYVQSPAPSAITLMWMCETNGAANVTCDGRRLSVTPRLATEMEYNLGGKEEQGSLPWQYKVRIENLSPGKRYDYAVGIGGEVYTNSFLTAPATRDLPLRFTFFADPETQPSSTGDCVAWEDPRDDASRRRYMIDQTVGLASNVASIAAFDPHLILIGGDLPEAGIFQTHWDEFWRHFSGDINTIAGRVPILAAPGNHDYYYYDKAHDSGEMAMRKYLSYFDFDRYHALDYGPAKFIFVDLNNGDDADPNKDTNIYLSAADGCRAPDFNKGSAQWKWIEEQLAAAKSRGLFTFVVSHQCPFSVGYHGRAMGEVGGEKYAEELSGVPTRALLELFEKYDVTAWFCGHDEIYEHSRYGKLDIYDVGIAGDGLRGRVRTEKENPYEIFRAHKHAPEVYNAAGLLESGGKHYGHLEVTISNNVCTIFPAYIFVSTNAAGMLKFSKRFYDDIVVKQK